MDSRIIFHIDVNNAFLSWTAVKLLKDGYPIDIRTIPSIIGGDETKRHGIVLAKSPVAKKYGIVTAETIYSAKKKCSKLQIFPPTPDYYREMSDQMFKYLADFSPSMERLSIDECFLDMSNTSLLYSDLVTLAYKIKDEIKIKFGFTVNIGIGNNKLCAKMASDFEKPDKVHTLYKEEVPKKMWPLSVQDLYMIGKKSGAKLQELGITTIGELAQTNVKTLEKFFKSQSKMMVDFANGIDDSPVIEVESKNKCISVSETLPVDCDDHNTLKKILLKQADEVGRSLRKIEMYTTTVAVTLRTYDFVNYSKQMTLNNPTNITEDIYKSAVIVFDQAWKEEKIRNIGIRISNFTTSNILQTSLFDNPNKKHHEIQHTLDNIKDRFGTNSIMPASLFHDKEKD